MSNKKNNIKTACIVLMVLNIFLVFYFSGMPKNRLCENEFRGASAGVSGRERVVRFTESFTIYNEDGDSMTFEEGSEYRVLKMSGGSLALIVSLEGADPYFDPIVLSEDEYKYEDITEEVNEKAAESNRIKNQNAKKEYDEYRKEMWLWPIAKKYGNIIYWIIAAIGGGIAIVCELIRYKKAVKADRIKRFITTDVILAVVFAAMSILYQLFPLLECR